MLLMLDGIDKYGPLNSVSANVQALLTQGEWTSATGTTVNIVAPLSATGYALYLTGGGTVSKTLAASYGKLIGGFRFSVGLGGTAGVQFLDGASNQVGIQFNTTGTISLRNGVYSSGTIIGTSTASITANTTHMLEWDVTLGNSAAYQLWLDGVSILSGTGDTTATANNTVSGLSFATVSGGTLTIDDFYLLDATGPAPLNAPLLTSPRIETQFPASDGAVQFAVGAAMLGSSLSRSAANFNAAANALYLRPLIPTRNCTLTAIGILPAATSATVQVRPVLYADSAALPGALMSAGSVVTGVTSGTILQMPLTAAQSLVAGSRYWFGAMTDISVNNIYAGDDGTTSARTATATFASGAPSTAPAMSAVNNGVIFGILAAIDNAYSVSRNPTQGSASYLYDATVGHEDLYNFPPLGVVPSAIYATAIKANVAKSDAGAKTVSIRQKSGSTDSSGGAQAPGTSFAWLTSLFPTDPNGGGAWTKSALDAAQGGVRVES